jgi:gamma-glutamyltranspeptidase/glutathione hydrolase
MNPEYAETLQALIDGGADAFYTGPIAEDIAVAVQGDLTIPGDMTVEDLAAYTVVQRDPVCIDYHGQNVCGMGPPASGGLAVGQIMGLLEVFDNNNTNTNPLDAANVHLFTQANRLAFADRNQYVGDPDFVSVPSTGMLDKDYLAHRATLIDTTRDMGTALPGTPPDVMNEEELMGADPRTKMTGTSHISIVDGYGNALSMASSVKPRFEIVSWSEDSF